MISRRRFFGVWAGALAALGLIRVRPVEPGSVDATDTFTVSGSTYWYAVYRDGNWVVESRDSTMTGTRC